MDLKVVPNDHEKVEAEHDNGDEGQHGGWEADPEIFAVISGAMNEAIGQLKSLPRTPGALDVDDRLYELLQNLSDIGSCLHTSQGEQGRSGAIIDSLVFLAARSVIFCHDVMAFVKAVEENNNAGGQNNGQ